MSYLSYLLTSSKIPRLESIESVLEGTKSFECNLCKYSFGLKTTLLKTIWHWFMEAKRHFNTLFEVYGLDLTGHSLKKPHQCQVCLKVFPKSLFRTPSYHTCEECGKDFRTPSSFKTHIGKHHPSEDVSPRKIQSFIKPPPAHAQFVT